MERRILIFFKEHWGVATSACIVFLSIAGFIFTSIYYKEFGLNYLDFAELSDLFTVIFVNPVFLLTLYLFLVYAILFYIFSNYLINRELEGQLEKERKVKSTRVFGITITLFIGLCLVIYVPYFMVLNAASSVKNNLVPIHEVTLADNKSEYKCLGRMGSTSTVYFYWDIKIRNSVVIPKSNVYKITVVKSKPPIKLLNQLPSNPKRGYVSEYDQMVKEWNEQVETLCKSIS